MRAYLTAKDREREERGFHGRTIPGPRVEDDDSLIGAYGSGLDAFRQKRGKSKRSR